MSRAEQQRRRQHRKHRKDRQRRETLAAPAEERWGRTYQVHSYTITNRQLTLAEYGDAAGDAVAQEDTRLASLHSDLYHEIEDNAASVIPQLCALLKAHPNSRLLMNWLTTSYRMVGQDEKARDLILRCYQLHPNYLFGRIAYANVLLDEDRVAEARDVMEDKWDLGAHFPHRDIFHETEYLAISQLAFRYFIVTGEAESARSLYDAMKDWDPEHALTSHMHKVLEGSTALRLMQRFLSVGRRRDNAR
jgi:hypothetical protein